jgi:hypothetical protein
MNIKTKITSFFIAALFINGFALAKDGNQAPHSIKFADLP